MARVDVATEQITSSGLVPNLTEPTVDGDVIDSGRVALLVENTTAGTVNATAQTPLQLDGDLDLAERQFAIPAGAIGLIGPFAKRYYGQPAGASESGGDDEGRVYVDYDVQTGVNRGVVTL